ncbi:MAG: ATP-dependent Clp protease adaptor ClpS [Chloroflexi bacterium]|nr:ATP-dependent Clp protease adaptor ClpS [Chloroflexota bacterium]
MTHNSKIVPGTHEDQQKKTAEEPLYRVIIHNDDVTPMDFVIHVLSTIFFVPDPNASHIMYSAHLNGLAYVQTLPRPEARRRIGQAHFAARLKSYPLQFTMEPE